MGHLQSFAQFPAEFIINLSCGLKLVLLFAGAGGGPEGVETHTRNISAVVLIALFEKQIATFSIVAESVARSASTVNSVLSKTNQS